MADRGNSNERSMEEESMETENTEQPPGHGEDKRQSSREKGSEVDPTRLDEMDYQGGADNVSAAYPGVFGASNAQAQMQEQMFRSEQASMQMVYGVYGNCITMLEELENRDQKKRRAKPLPRSNIEVSDQSRFDDATIQRKLDTQLILLRAQLTSCHDGIKDEVKEELKKQTLHWSSRREELKLNNGLVDEYSAKLYELLEVGHTEYPKEFDQPPTISESGIKHAMGAIMVGNHQKSKLDDDFKKDPKKKAAGPNLRKTAGIDKGADRISRNRPGMESSVNNHRTSIR